MNKSTKFITINYRNGMYQGLINKSSEEKNGYGLTYTLHNHAIMGSYWEFNKASGPTFFYSHTGQYIYGYWKNNMPHGFNYIKMKDMAIMAFYDSGKVAGHMLIIYEKYNFAVVVTAIQSSFKTSFDTVYKGEIYSDEDFQYLVKQCKWQYFEQNWKTLIKFLSANFTTNQDIKTPKLKLRFVNQRYYRFGFDDGIAFMINDEYSFVSVGIHKKSKLKGLGIRSTAQKFIQEGDFNSETDVLAYSKSSQRPSNKIQRIFSSELIKGLDYINQYISNPTKTLFLYYTELQMQHLFKHLLAGQITNRKLDISYGQKNQSLKSSMKNSHKREEIKFEIDKNSNRENKLKTSRDNLINIQTDQEDERRKLEILKKQIMHEISKKKKSENIYQQIHSNNLPVEKTIEKQIITRKPVFIGKKQYDKFQDKQKVSNRKPRNRSPIFTPEKKTHKGYNDESPSPIKDIPASPFGEKMRSKIFKGQTKRKGFIYESIEEKEPKSLQKFNNPPPYPKVVINHDSDDSPLKDFKYSYSKGESIYHPNMIPISMKKVQQPFKINEDQKQYYNKSEKSSKDKKKKVQFVGIDQEVSRKRKSEEIADNQIYKNSNKKSPSTNTRRNNIYLEGIKIQGHQRKKSDYDNKFERSKPKTYAEQYRQKSSEKKGDIYTKTVKSFNVQNKVFDLVSSPKHNAPAYLENSPDRYSSNNRKKYDYYFK